MLVKTITLNDKTKFDEELTRIMSTCRVDHVDTHVIVRHNEVWYVAVVFCKTVSGSMKPVATFDYSGSDLRDLGLSIRTLNCLMRSNITSIDDLLAKLDTDKRLRSVYGVGHEARLEILQSLADYGVDIRDYYD